MFSYYSKDERTDHERYLEQELEDVREAENRRYEQEERAREERRREREEMWRYEERQADTWPEAFRKQACLCWREHNHYADVTGDPLDDYFKNMAQANEKALEIWKQVAASKQAQLDELQRRIDAVWDSVRQEVADQLEAASELTEYKSTAQCVRDDELENYLDW